MMVLGQLSSMKYTTVSMFYILNISWGSYDVLCHWSAQVGGRDLCQEPPSRIDIVNGIDKPYFLPCRQLVFKTCVAPIQKCQGVIVLKKAR